MTKTFARVKKNFEKKNFSQLSEKISSKRPCGLRFRFNDSNQKSTKSSEILDIMQFPEKKHKSQ